MGIERGQPCTFKLPLTLIFLDFFRGFPENKTNSVFYFQRFLHLE